MEPKYRNEAWLRAQYWEHSNTQQDIAAECDVSPRTIRKYMNRFDIETRDLEGEMHPLHGTSRDEETKEQIAETLSGRTLSEEWRANIAAGHEGTSLPEEVREQISDSLTGQTRSAETRQKMSESTAGKNNPNWRGGYSRRYGSGWNLARERIIDRDGVCQACHHDGSEARLEVHHIIPVRQFRQADNATLEEAHQPENLVLLCRTCHRKADHGRLDLEAGIPSPDVDESHDSG
jgi:5-methylcytosine-specific restriction endonuclease McrA